MERDRDDLKKAPTVTDFNFTLVFDDRNLIAVCIPYIHTYKSLCYKICFLRSYTQQFHCGCSKNQSQRVIKSVARFLYNETASFTFNLFMSDMQFKLGSNMTVGEKLM